MIKKNYFLENADMMAHFDSLISWNEIVESYEGGFRENRLFRQTGDQKYSSAPSGKDEAVEYYRTVLESVGDLAGNYISQAAAQMDRTGLEFKDGTVTFPPEMVELYRMAKDAGIQPYGFSRKYGGLGLPWTVKGFLNELVYRADGSMAIAIGCVNLAEILERYASEEMKNEFLPPMASGKYAAAMGLTEPDHGSDLPGIRTTAKKVNGQYLLNGTKRFITHGCGMAEDPAIILTLARTGDRGARGLSLFLVKSTDVQVAGIEKKLGLHCSPTCEIVFENSPGLLIEEEGFGLIKYTMGMLNGARLGIAFQSTGLATAAFDEAGKYARERIQFGSPLEEIPAVRKILNRMERDIAAMRSLYLEGCRAMDMYYWRSIHLTEDGASEKEAKNDTVVKYWEKLAGVLTPLCKYYCAETCVRITGDGVQVHGGAGFTEDYDAARLYRDARITTIYDGTSQIQVLAAIGGIVQGMSGSGQLREYFNLELERADDAQMLQKLYNLFDAIVSSYRALESDQKEYYAEETVLACARFWGGLLLDRSLRKLRGEALEKRRLLSREYNRESLGILSGIQARMETLMGAAV